MKIYISTPINARNEQTFEQKYNAARQRVEHIIEVLHEEPQYHDATFVSTFDLCPLGTKTESEAIGRCVQAVMESDMLYFDCRASESKGCSLEYWTACIYGKPVISASLFGRLKGYDPMTPAER